MLPVPDDRDLLAGEPVDALVASVYADLADLEQQVRWAEHRADAAEARLRQEWSHRLRHPGRAAAVQDAIEHCAATARAHQASAVSAAAEQAEAILTEACLRADGLVAGVAAVDPADDPPDALAPLPAPAAVVPVVPAPAAAAPVVPGPAAPAPRTASARRPVPLLPAGDAEFERFWAESEVAADTPRVLQADSFARGLASTMAAVVVLVLLLLQLT